MAGLTPSVGSTSALLRTANSLATQLQSNQDAEMASQWDASNKTDDDLAAYVDYLNQRIGQETANGSATAQGKVISLSNTIRTAQRANTSSDISAANIQVINGSATKQDKYNVISQQYIQAVNNGDLSLAQSLESQAYSLSQSIQVDAQNAASAAKTLASAGATDQQNVADNLGASLSQLNADIKEAGAKNLNSSVSTWLNAKDPTTGLSNSDVLAKMGVNLPAGAQPNYFSLVQAVAGAQYQAHMLAYSALKDTDPEQALKYLNQAIAINNGTSKIDTLAGSMSVNDINDAITDPSRFAYDQSTGTLKQTKISNQVVTSPGNVSPQFTGSIEQTIFLTPKQTTQMNELALQFSSTKGVTGNGVQVQATANSPTWLTSVLGKNGVTNMNTVNGNLQFVANAKDGVGQDVYTIVKDANGNQAIMGSGDKTDPLGRTPQVFLGSDPNFNMNVGTPGGASSVAHTTFLNKITSEITGGLGRDSSGLLRGFLNWTGGHASAQDLINYGATQFQLAQANAKAAAALLAYTPPTLPTISIAPSVAPTSITSIPNPTIAPKTVNPQQPTVNPQQPAGIKLQGSSGSLQGGSFNLQ